MIEIRPDRPSDEYEALLTPRRVRAIMWNVTRRSGTPFVDDDLAQEALVRALVAFRRGQPIRRPTGLLAKVVRDTVVDHWRRLPASRRLLAIDDCRFPASEACAEEIIDRNRRLARLRTAVAGLDSGRRELVALFYADGLTVAEIGTRLGKSQSAVKMGLLRSRRQLTRRLRR